MSKYVIGDVQGCYDELTLLLQKIEFNPVNDNLYFLGDLINRGPKSLEVLNFCLQHRESVTTILGNHDIYLLYLISNRKQNYDLQDVLDAPNLDAIYQWLITKPLLLKVSCDQGKNFYLTHAGVPHIWSLEDAMHYNAEFMMAATHDAEKMFRNMWGDLPSKWNPKLKGYSRLRTIINYFTRMRLVDDEGNMDLKTKTFDPESSYKPWFTFNSQILQNSDTKILFGHWAALKGATNLQNIIGLDTGCVWGGTLSAMRLEDHKIFQVESL